MGHKGREEIHLRLRATLWPQAESGTSRPSPGGGETPLGPAAGILCCRERWGVGNARLLRPSFHETIREELAAARLRLLLGSRLSAETRHLGCVLIRRLD